MKSCSYCGKKYPNDATECAIDGQPLIDSVVVQTPTNVGWRRFFGGIPELPVTEEQKAWIEESFQWLLDEFGTDNFLKHKVILPELSFFPDHYKGTEECVDKLVERVCSYMDVDPKLIDVVFLVDRDETAAKYRTGNADPYSGAAGLYFSKTVQNNLKRIAINVSQFKDPANVVATVAHELGHVILLGGGKISQKETSHEYLTDLITVFFGLGIFTANSAFQFSQWQDHSHQGWKTSRTGYLSEEMFAYSLAAYAWMRGETNPNWSKYLAMNVGHYFKQSMRYLVNGGQTSLRQLTPLKA
jgi:hypothetical protein